MERTETGYGIFWAEAMSRFEGDLSDQEYNMWFNRMSYLEKKQRDKQFGKMVKSVLKNKQTKR